MSRPNLIGYTVTYSANAQKSLEKLSKKEFEQIHEKINGLCSGMPNLNIKKLVISKRDLYRLRVSNFRIIYSIEHQQVNIHVIAIGPRKDVYDKLSRLLGLITTIFLR
jgi:mRNA interferase RelE/StbE